MRRSRLRGLCTGARGTWWTYTGQHTVRQIDAGGEPRTLITLRTSGLLTVSGTLRADVWMCGCGARGGDGIAGVRGGDGGAGAYVAKADGLRLATGTATIATTPLGLTMFAGLSAAGGSARNGGTGGGGGAMVGGVIAPGGAGDGKADKVPFGLADVFSPHCAGGAGGGFLGGGTGRGGDGGTDGGDGLPSMPGEAHAGGKGGAYGGGSGGIGFAGAMPVDALGGTAHFTQFGSGGGGGGSGFEALGNASGGVGTEGVVYILLESGA